MALPSSREEFKQYCLRALGSPVIEINVSDEQVEDRIDEALSYYYDYHFDGSHLEYYKHVVTQDDKDNGYISMPENIIGVINLFPFGGWGVTSTNDIFNINYQIALNDLYNLTNLTMIPYYMTREHLSLIQEMLVGKQPLRYERHRNRLHLDMNWDKINVGNYIIVEAYQVINPETYEDVWKDRWLYRYCTALIKKVWGANLTKYVGMQLPGGVQFNGDRILTDAQTEIDKMEAEMISSYSLPPMDFVG